VLRVWLLSMGAGAVVLAAWQIATNKNYPAGLPAAVRDDLSARGCDMVREHGVLTSPAFTAVLCRIGDQASLILYSNGQRTPVEVNRHPGGLDEQNHEALRRLRSVDWDYVVRHNPGLKPATHPRTCVADELGMGSVLYCYLGGKWVRLDGAD